MLAPRPTLQHQQKLAMTPQLRQAIALLSLNNDELTRALRQAAADNPCVVLRGAVAGPDPERIAAAPDGLAGHVVRQIGLEIRQDRDRRIAHALLESLEPWGWLGRPLAEIARDCGCGTDEAEAVLIRMQQFEPAGIFARSLAECLSLQARESGLLDPVMTRLLANLDLAAAGNMAALAAACGSSPEAVANRLGTLRRFDPKPGLRFAPAAPVPTGAPDVVFTRQGTAWSASLNRSALPDIVVLDGLDRDQRRAGDRLRRALIRRNRSVLAVAGALATRQSTFLDGGEAPAPLTLTALARMAGRHPSTIGRITAALTADTPRGVLPLRALMGRTVRGAGIGTDDLKRRIAGLIAAEDPARPLSDADLTGLLRARGVAIVRRTVAKYRAAQGIEPASARRRAGRC